MSRRRGIFDGLPIPADKSYLKEGLSRIDESWAAARFDSLPHVVHILTSKDREGEIQFLKEQSDLIEDVVDEVVHAYHHGFNKAIQNYSQILRLFSESAESIAGLKGEMEETKKLLGRKNKHLGQLWYRSLTLHHVLSLLDQIEDVAKVPARIENLIAEKQLYAAVQLHVQSVLILEREGLQAVGALQDVRSDLTKLRGVLFYKILDELHGHLYNNGEYSSATLCLVDSEEVPTSTSTASGRLENSMQPFSRRTRLIKGDNHITGLVDGFPKVSSVDGGSSFDGPDDNSLDMSESDGQTPEGFENLRSFSREIPIFLSCATPDEFLESMIKADAPLNVKYLRTLVQCLSMLGKVAAAGAVIWFNSCHTINYRHILKEKRNRSSKVDVSSGFTFFLRQGLNPRISFFLGRGRREYLVPLYRTSSLVLGLALAFVLIFSCPLYLHRRKMGIEKNRRGHHFFFLS